MQPREHSAQGPGFNSQEGPCLAIWAPAHRQPTLRCISSRSQPLGRAPCHSSTVSPKHLEAPATHSRHVQPPKAGGVGGCLPLSTPVSSSPQKRIQHRACAFLLGECPARSPLANPEPQRVRKMYVLYSTGRSALDQPRAAASPSS